MGCSSSAAPDILLQHPAVVEAAVIGMPDAKWGERPLTLIVLKHDLGEKCDADALKTYIREHANNGAISHLAIPEHIQFVDAPERTSVGKLNKKAMREKYGKS